MSVTEAQGGMLSPAQMMAQKYESQQMDNMVSENVESLDNWSPTTMKTPNDFDNKLNSVVPQQPRQQITPPPQAASGVPLAEQPVELDMSTIASLTKNASKAVKKSQQISQQNRPSNINFEAPQPHIANG